MQNNSKRSGYIAALEPVEFDNNPIPAEYEATPEFDEQGARPRIENTVVPPQVCS